MLRKVGSVFAAAKTFFYFTLFWKGSRFQLLVNSVTVLYNYNLVNNLTCPRDWRDVLSISAIPKRHSKIWRRLYYLASVKNYYYTPFLGQYRNVLTRTVFAPNDDYFQHFSSSCYRIRMIEVRLQYVNPSYSSSFLFLFFCFFVFSSKMRVDGYLSGQ